MRRTEEDKNCLLKYKIFWRAKAFQTYAVKYLLQKKELEENKYNDYSEKIRQVSKAYEAVKKDYRRIPSNYKKEILEVSHEECERIYPKLLSSYESLIDVLERYHGASSNRHL